MTRLTDTLPRCARGSLASARSALESLGEPWYPVPGSASRLPLLLLLLSMVLVLSPTVVMAQDASSDAADSPTPAQSAAASAPTQARKAAVAAPLAPKLAAPANPSATPAKVAAAALKLVPKDALDQARSALDAVQKTLVSDTSTDSAGDLDLANLRAAALAARAAGDATATELAPQLADVQARLAQLGTLTAGAREMPDVAAERAALQQSSSALDAQVKLARLLTVDAEQTVSQIATRRRQQFQNRLGERGASILGPRFWSEVSEDAPRDARQVLGLLQGASAVVVATPALALAGVLLAVSAIAALRIALRRWLFKLTATQVPASRLRRSLHAFTVVVLSVGTAAGAAAALSLPLLGALTSGAPPSAPLAALPPLVLGAVCFGAYVAGLGKALLAPSQPSWRLTAVPDHVAQGLRWFPLQLGLLIVGVWVTEGLASLLNTSLATTVALNCITALAIGAAMALAIMRAERLRREAEREPEHPTPVRPFWLVMLFGAAWLTLAASLLALLLGYVALGSFVIKQIVWTQVVLGSAYLLAVLVEDLVMALLVSPPDARASNGDGDGDGDDDTNSLRDIDGDDHKPHPYRIGEQAAVLLSGMGRLVISLLALMLLLAPFGEGPAELFRRTDKLQNGLNIGEVHILPGAVLQALLVLTLALAGVKVLQRWLQNNYLPTTRLDTGMQSSATTLLGYAGYVCAVSLAMSAVGIGLDRIAWVASALSVGIGFGLQAVVQNFVSGLILLAERPVKVGDWVSLGTVEGDIRRINMRATEIQLGDRSTVIVPNSEFITKTVRNVTHANPLGLVQIKLPMPLGTPANDVRTLLLAVLQDNPDILKTPAPNVQLDGIDHSMLVFNATGYVMSPRAAYGVRSALLFEALSRLAAAGIDLSAPAQVITLSGCAGAGLSEADPAGATPGVASANPMPPTQTGTA